MFLGQSWRQARQLSRQESTAFSKQILCTFSSTMTGSFKIDDQKRSGEYSHSPVKRAASITTLCKRRPRATWRHPAPDHQGGELPCWLGFLSPHWLQARSFFSRMA